MWFTQPFERFHEYVGETYRLCILSIRGIHEVRQALGLAEVLYEAPGPVSRTPEPGEAEAIIKEAKQFAELAQQEIGNDFPLMNAHALVGVWGALEVCIDDTIVAVLLHDSDIRKSELFMRVKVRVAEFEELDSDDRMRLLLDEAKRLLRLEHRIGPNVFESVLDTIGLSGPVDDALSKHILELQQLRHVLVHRGGMADQRLCGRCPWLGLKPGERIMLKRTDLSRLLRAVQSYAQQVEGRVIAKYGGHAA